MDDDDAAGFVELIIDEQAPVIVEEVTFDTVYRSILRHVLDVLHALEEATELPNVYLPQPFFRLREEVEHYQGMYYLPPQVRNDSEVYWTGLVLLRSLTPIINEVQESLFAELDYQ